MAQNDKYIVRIDADLKDLIPRVIENMRKDVTALYEAFERDDFQTIRNLGHRTKGDGGTWGFDVISDIGKSIEKSAQEKSSEEIQRWIDEFSNYLEQVKIVYD